MINTAKMKGRITEKETTIQNIAPEIPCTPYTLGQQIGNKVPMTLDTAEKLCEILDINTKITPLYFRLSKSPSPSL